MTVAGSNLDTMASRAGGQYDSAESNLGNMAGGAGSI
jgi:hypothetical protein